ncbi:predicted protein [Chaetomium globosum CBS 148.51]|uniref:Uncharacterized protein n=1 Tax=Chaetomium globosum (strain ATCC 6205 / CBS 148.51 / DSM 1962 / NBRC 6347 / NRRL 1970) TaxID=306901 RepID=Q2HCX3_CHAGB|nr:uncharacterized protein CHGG_01931 [Chaetomium globosum CBS 148.51]EAQ93696.1 predicted protein [Chaetomium globosum CBS 148.51]
MSNRGRGVPLQSPTPWWLAKAVGAMFPSGASHAPRRRGRAASVRKETNHPTSLWKPPQDVQLLIFLTCKRCISFAAVPLPVFKASYGASSERFDGRSCFTSGLLVRSRVSRSTSEEDPQRRQLVCGRAAVLRLLGAWARQAFVGPVSPPRARSPSEGEVFTDGFLWQHTSCDGALAACGECSISHGECSGNGYWRKGGQSALELKTHKGQGSIDSTVCQ